MDTVGILIPPNSRELRIRRTRENIRAPLQGVNLAQVNLGVYSIKNIINGKCYIGSTNNLNRRKKEHFLHLKNNKHKNRHLQFAWNKYKEENFQFEILETTNEINALQELEQFYLNKLENGYNIRMNANNNRGIKMPPRTEEQRRHSSELRKGKPSSFKGKTHTEESKKKNREAHIGCIPTEETREKISKATKREIRYYEKENNDR